MRYLFILNPAAGKQDSSGPLIPALEAALAALLEEAMLTGSPEERALAREYEAALDEALRCDPLGSWQDEAFCNCGGEARGEAFDGFDL